MKKKKVMHVLCMGGYSGAENVAITIIDGIKEDFDCVYVSPPGNIQDILKDNDIIHYKVDSVTVKSIRRAIKDIKPDIIHAHDFNAGVVCAIVAGKIPIVNHLHNNPPWIKTYNIRTNVYGLACMKFSKILTVSNSVMEEFVLGHRYKNKSQMIGNPISIKKVKRYVKNNNEENIYDLIFLGRLTEQKNPRFFLEIMDSLCKKNDTLTAAIVGDGELRKEIDEQIKNLNLQKNITVYGFVKNPYAILARGKVLCMPSKWEGFGLAAVEALALGKPVIAAPVGGLVDIINSECGGFCSTISEYTANIESLLYDDKLYRIKSEKAFQRADELENIERYINSIRNIYMRL